MSGLNYYATRDNKFLFIFLVLLLQPASYTADQHTNMNPGDWRLATGDASTIHHFPAVRMKNLSRHVG
jgi:hypothetical protein